MVPLFLRVISTVKLLVSAPWCCGNTGVSGTAGGLPCTATYNTLRRRAAKHVSPMTLPTRTYLDSLFIMVIDS